MSQYFTLWRSEKVEEGVVRNRLGDGPHSAAALVLLFLLDCFQCDVLALYPIDCATAGKSKHFICVSDNIN